MRVRFGAARRVATVHAIRKLVISMNKEKLGQLEFYYLYKYSELCELLGESVQQGNSKKAQEKEWIRHFDFDKVGKNKGMRYIIRDIYDTEKRKSLTGNSKYVRRIEALLSYALINYCESKQKNEIKIMMSYKSIAYMLYMLNDNNMKKKRELQKIAHDNEISMQAFNSFIHADKRYIQTKIERALNDMQRNKEIIWKNVHIGDFSEENCRFGEEDHRVLTEDEYLAYAEIEKDVIREFVPGCRDTGKGMWMIIRQDKEAEFYSEVNNRAYGRLGFCGVYHRYEIYTRKKLMMYAAERLTELEYQDAAEELNKEICAGLRKSKAMLRHQKEKCFIRNGKKIVIPEKNIVTEQERDYLVDFFHGIKAEAFTWGEHIRQLKNELDVNI